MTNSTAERCEAVVSICLDLLLSSRFSDWVNHPLNTDAPVFEQDDVTTWRGLGPVSLAGLAAFNLFSALVGIVLPLIERFNAGDLKDLAGNAAGGGNHNTSSTSERFSQRIEENRSGKPPHEAALVAIDRNKTTNDRFVCCL